MGGAHVIREDFQPGLEVDLRTVAVDQAAQRLLRGGSSRGRGNLDPAGEAYPAAFARELGASRWPAAAL